MAKILIYLFIFVIGFMAISFWNFWIVTHPQKIILNQKPSNFGLPSEEITLITEDGLNLSAWFIEPNQKQEEKKRAIILLHGYPAEKSDMLNIASSLYPDFSLFLLDLRYFGKSDGKQTTLGVKEKEDLRLATDFLKLRGYEKIGIFGFSIGGTIAILNTSTDKRINAVASYGASYNLRSLGREAYKNLLVLKYPMVELMIMWSKIFFGESVEENTPATLVTNLNIPIMIIHSKQDEQISFKHAEKFKEALKEKSEAQFYFLEKGLHGKLPYDFNDKLKNFFNQTL